MGTFEDRRRQYETVDEPSARKKHIAMGIRRKFAEDFDMSGLSDQEVIQRHYNRFGEGMSAEEYGKKLLDTYGTDYTAPEAPSPTVRERFEIAGDHGKEFLRSLVPFLVPEAPKVAAHVAPRTGLAAVAKGAATKIPVASQVGFLLGHTANAQVDTQTAEQLQRTAAAIPVPDAKAITEDFFNKLRPGLSARGFTDDQIMQEARWRAQNIVHGYEKTTQSIQQDVADTQEAAAVREPAAAAADAFFLGVGAPAIEGLLNKGLVRLGIKAVPGAATSTASRSAAATVAGHVRTGVVVGAPGMAIHGAVEAGIHAAAENKTPDEIAHALVTGGKKGALEGALGGALLGGAAGSLEAGVGAAVRPIAARRAAAQAKITESLFEAQRAKASAIRATAESFNPHTAQIPMNANPAEVATTIVQQAHGEDAAMSEAGLRAASEIERRIRTYQEANVALEGNIPAVPVGPLNRHDPSIQPVGAPLQQSGGIAPSGAAPESVQGPLGERSPTFTPPEEVLAAPEGLERVPEPQQVEVPFERTGVAPEEGPRARARLEAPLGPVSNSAGVERPAPMEPNARELPPSDRFLGGTTTLNPAPSPLVEGVSRPVEPTPPPAPVEPKPAPPEIDGAELVDRAIEDAIALGDHAKALKLVDKYDRPMPEGLPKKAVNDLLLEGDHAAALKLAEKYGLRKAPEPKGKATTEKPAETKPAETPAAAAPAPAPAPEPSPVAASVTPPTPAPATATAAATPTGAQALLDALIELPHATLTKTPEGNVRIDKLTKVSKPGDTSQALDTIVREADLRGVRLETSLVPPPGPRGGRIPLEKVIPWYEARGFKVVETTKIPEGNLATARLVRDPVTTTNRPAAQAATEEAMRQSGDKKYIAARPGPNTPSEKGFVYHATNLDNADAIAQEGLKLHRPWHGTDQQVWPDGGNSPRAYFTDNAGAAWQFAPDEGVPVIIRTRDSAKMKKESGTGDRYIQESIPATHLQILTESGEWVQLSTFFKRSK